MTVKIGAIIRKQREDLKLTQPQLAERVGVTERQISRYESDAQEPAASTCKALARALNLSLPELFGEVPIRLDLSGDWCAAWQTSRGGKPVVDRHGLTASHAGDRIVFSATGDYLWSGDLVITDGSLSGVYRSTELGRQFRGSLYFLLSDDALDPDNVGAGAAIGRWTGLWADGLLGSGWGAIARTAERADRLLDWLMTEPRPITEWPHEDELDQIVDWLEAEPTDRKD